MSLVNIDGEGPLDAALYAATTVRSPLDVALQVEHCRSWLAGSRLNAVGAFADDAGRGRCLDQREGFQTLLRAVQGGTPFVVVSSLLDLAGTERLACQAIAQLARAGATILSASMRSGLALEGAIGSIEDGLLQTLGLQRGRRHEDLAPSSLANLIESHCEEAAHRWHEDLRRRPAADSRNARSHRPKES